MDPIDSNFARVLSWESARIVFNHAASNSLDVTAGDIESAHLQAPTLENIV